MFEETIVAKCLSQLVAFLESEKMSFEIHTNKDVGYEYLDDDSRCVRVLGKYPVELYVDFDDVYQEGTLTFNLWHEHFALTESEMQELTYCLQCIFRNEYYVLTMFSGKEYLLSSLFVAEELTRDALAQYVKKQNFEWETISDNGVSVVMTFWDNSLSQHFDFEANEIK